MSQDRIIELNSLLVGYRHEYYVLNDPTTSDAHYDTTEKELKGLVKSHPELAHLAPVLQTVGSDLADGGGRVKHARPMLSLENEYTITGLLAWVQGVVDRIPDVFISSEPKVDGASLSNTYLDRKLVKCVTRGDGTYGEDCTALMAASGAIPLTLKEADAPSTLVEIRGEVWMSTGQMDRLNAEQVSQGKKPWASTRNLASGTMKLKDLQEVKRRVLRFAPWDCFGIGDDHLGRYNRSSQWKTHTLDYLNRIGFSQPFTRSIPGKDLIQSLQLQVDQLQVERESLWHSSGIGMLTDGLVFKVESQAHRDILGEDGRVPNWARSYKFQDSVGQTTLEDVEWGISRNGKLTPVGILEPLILNGASISRVTLNNWTWMQDMGIRETPCVVEICRSGDVIPMITKVIE